MKTETSGHGLLTFGGGNISAFTNMRHSSPALFMPSSTKFSTSLMRWGELNSWRAVVFVSKASCVQPPMLPRMTLTSNLFSAMVVSKALMFWQMVFFISFSILTVVVIKTFRRSQDLLDDSVYRFMGWLHVLPSYFWGDHRLRLLA